MVELDIKSRNLEQLTKLMEELGEPKYRAKQIYKWLHKDLTFSYEEMNNIPKTLKEKLRSYEITNLNLIHKQVSKLDGTSKFLFMLEDKNVVEAVLMRYNHGNTVCISSQVGCRMGCKFCASTIGGLTRNLKISEMLDEVYKIQKLTGERVSNIVLMGTGEPLDNFDNVCQFIEIISGEQGLNISQRNITLSTCGIVPNIYELGKKKYAITLAISLHAPNDEKRQELMPIAFKYSIAEIMKSVKWYFKETGRRISFEYSLVAGINDTDKDSIELSKLLRGINGHVNLIPVNPIKERDYEKSTREAVLAFKNKLEKNNINVTIRREMGSDIDGACGQLRKSYMDKEEREM